MTDQVNPTSIFDEGKKPVEENKQPTSVQQTDQSVKPDVNAIFKDHLSSIVDDSGEPKYKDVFTALDALKHTQDYVKTLQDENRQFRESQTQNTTMEEALRKLSANKEQNDSTKSPALDADTIKGLSLETIRQYEADKSARANEQAVSDALVKKFGDADKAKAEYASKALELGVDVDTLRSLAQRSPKAVLSYFDVKSTQSFDKNLNGSVNTAALNTNPNQQEKPRNIMYGATTGDMVGAWKSAGQSVLNELGIK